MEYPTRKRKKEKKKNQSINSLLLLTINGPTSCLLSTLRATPFLVQQLPAGWKENSVRQPVGIGASVITPQPDQLVQQLASVNEPHNSANVA
jgi:hypothetical protein